MSKVYYDDEDDQEMQDSHESQEEEVFNMTITEKVKETSLEEIYQVSSYDIKVARTVVSIHLRAKANADYIRWVNKNYYHLLKMYSLSNLRCSQEDFFSYVYDNTKRK